MKAHLLLSSIAGLLLAGQAIAIVDANANTLSDVWERHYNGNALFSASNPAHAPTADPDGDGWTNEKEAIAGTDPFSPILPAGLVQTTLTAHPESSGTFIISWNTQAGKLYKLRVSSDLTTWADLGEDIPGTGSDIEIGIDASDDEGGIPSKLFWRVVVTDTDPDGDTLSSWEEIKLGYNPNHPDTDLDGIPDNSDPAPLSSATVADPDGLGLPADLATGLIGRWDFESQLLNTSPPTGYPPFRFADLTTGNRPAHAFGVQIDPNGMVSKAASHNGTFTTIAPSLLNGRTTYSVSFWASITPGSITTAPKGLFSHHRYHPFIGSSGGPDWAYNDTNLNGVWVQKVGTQVSLRAGAYTYTNYKIVGNQPQLLNPPTSTTSGVEVSLPVGKIDDGAWHHYVMTRGGGKTILYVDGVKQGEVSHAASTITADTYTGISVGRLHGASPDAIASQPASPTAITGKVDRLRVWSRAIDSTDVGSIYHQDIDRDGLWDITEAKTSLWRDANSDGVAAASEYSYISSPFQWQPSDRDTDGDEATDIEEQTAGTDIGKADTDGDLIPDGWELHHGLNPLDPSDGLIDPDHDGLNNRQEWQYNTNPHNANSDGNNPDYPDTVNDGTEVTNGSDPNDPTDGGEAPAEETKVKIKLAVGDQSGSESEDYVMHCYKIDKQSGQETRVYTLRSGGFGQYASETSSIFREGESYSFQIHWQGSKLTSRPASPGIPAEGPDFDYTFKVEPDEETTDAILIDSWNSETGKPDTQHPLIAQDASDVAVDASEFREKFEKKRVVLLAAETVVGEPGTADEQPGDWVVAEAYPKPSVEMTITSAQIVGSGLQVTLQGTVVDPISKFASSSSERPQTLKFIQNGTVLKTISIGTSVSTGFSFNETITIPNAKPISYLIRAETSANVAGLTGFDQSVVSLTWEEDASAYPTLSAPLSIYFPTAPTSGTVDQAIAYVGTGSPPGGSPVLTESAADSGAYSGQLIIPAAASSITAPCEFTFTLPRTFSTTTADSIVLDFRFTAPGFPTNTIYGRWLETGPDTRIFRPYGWSFGNRTLKVAYTSNLPGTVAAQIEPATLRLPVLPGQGNTPGDFKIISGGTSFDLLKINGAWYPKDPLKSGAPKLFLPSSLAVPSRLSAPGYNASEGKLSLKLKLDESTEVDAPEMSVLPGVPETNSGNRPAARGSNLLGANDPWAPGQPVQLHQMIWAYRLIHGDDDFALELLNGYLRGGHQIEMGDVIGDLDLDVELNDLFTDSDNIWTIQIEEDWNPVHCARLLFEGLKQASCYSEVYNHYQFEDPFDNIIAFKTALDVAVTKTQENAIFATQMYLSGFGIVNEGADWILIFNDVSEGHYESLAGALPFIPASLVKGTGHLIIRKVSGEVLESLDEAGVTALRQICRENDLRVMGTLMDEHQFGESIRKALASNGGRIHPPTDQQGLRKAMEAISPRPAGKVHAHHDFPWSLRDWFAQHGIDVNDPAFGRWVSKIEHESWHSGAGAGLGGQFHAEWRAFISNEPATPYTVSQILDKLAQIRSQFAVTN